MTASDANILIERAHARATKIIRCHRCGLVEELLSSTHTCAPATPTVPIRPVRVSRMGTALIDQTSPITIPISVRTGLPDLGRRW